MTKVILKKTTASYTDCPLLSTQANSIRRLEPRFILFACVLNEGNRKVFQIMKFFNINIRI